MIPRILLRKITLRKQWPHPSEIKTESLKLSNYLYIYNTKLHREERQQEEKYWQKDYPIFQPAFSSYSDYSYIYQ